MRVAKPSLKKQIEEQKRQLILERRERIRQGLKNANSIAQLRALIKDLAEEIGITD